MTAEHRGGDSSQKEVHAALDPPDHLLRTQGLSQQQFGEHIWFLTLYVLQTRNGSYGFLAVKSSRPFCGMGK